MQASNIVRALQQGLPHAGKVRKALVIGAGTAGLAAAQILRKSGIEVVTLEATHRHGGRIWSLRNFGEKPVEAGAEFIHDGTSALMELAEAHQKMLLNANAFEDLYYFQKRIWEANEAYNHADFAEMENFYSLLEEADFSEENRFIPFTQFLDVIESPARLRHIVAGFLEISYGTSLDKIDAVALQQAWRQWKTDAALFAFESAGFLDLIEEFCPDALPTVLYGKPISQLRYSAAGVQASTPAGETWDADIAVLTVPLGVLKKCLITFSPALPTEKAQAIETIGIDAGVKVLLKFKQAFWDTNVGALYGDGYVHQFYRSGKGDAILTAISMGDKAQHLSQAGEAAAVQIALKELATMLDNDLPTRLFVEGRLVDWGAMPFQWGAYSYPSFRSDEARAALARPLPPLYFAGEATHTGGHFATVHGALETGYLACREALGK